MKISNSSFSISTHHSLYENSMQWESLKELWTKYFLPHILHPIDFETSIEHFTEINHKNFKPIFTYGPRDTLHLFSGK